MKRYCCRGYLGEGVKDGLHRTLFEICLNKVGNFLGHASWPWIYEHDEILK